MSLFKIFVVEDDPWYGEMLKYHLLLNPDYEVYLFETAKECLDNLHLKPDTISIDYYLPDINGGELFSKIKSIDSSIPVLVISSQDDIGVALDLLKKGVYGYILKDDNTKEFLWNMAAIPKELVESELFGHEKGSFTGAISRKIGKFEEANGGSLFLDEIAELDINMQVKLLRVLQEREVVRVGGNERIKFNARLITATNKNLTEEVKLNRFRKDLYYRIIGLPIELPPLRDRGNDILILAQYFVDEFSNENKMKPPKITSEAKEKLMKYSYQGNVRELKSIIDLACVMSKSGDITEDCISFYTDIIHDDLYTSMEKTLKEYNADIISYFLKKYNNNVVNVAKKLDIGKSTIYNMIKSGEIVNKDSQKK